MGRIKNTMNANASFAFIFSIVTIAISSVLVTAILYWVARSLISSSGSLKKLIEDVNVNIGGTVEMLQKSIIDVNEITRRVGDQMDRVEKIVGNAGDITEDLKTSADMINRTIVPTLGNLHAVAAGARKAVDTWNEYGTERQAGLEPDAEAGK